MLQVFVIETVESEGGARKRCIHTCPQGGPADDAGLRDGDILLSVGGTDVEDMKTFWKAMKLHKKVFNKVSLLCCRLASFDVSRFSLNPSLQSLLISSVAN